MFHPKVSSLSRISLIVLLAKYVHRIQDELVIHCYTMVLTSEHTTNPQKMTADAAKIHLVALQTNHDRALQISLYSSFYTCGKIFFCCSFDDQEMLKKHFKSLDKDIAELDV